MVFYVGGVIKILESGRLAPTKWPLAIPTSALLIRSGAVRAQVPITRPSRKWGARLDETQNFTFRADETAAFFLRAGWLAKVGVSFRRNAWLKLRRFQALFEIRPAGIKRQLKSRALVSTRRKISRLAPTRRAFLFVGWLLWSGLGRVGHPACWAGSAAAGPGSGPSLPK